MSTQIHAQIPSAYAHLRSPQDAILVLEGVRCGLLPRCSRRLTGGERSQIGVGTVWVWEEEETNMRRWTDGRRWGASRVGGGGFLIYREVENAAAGLSSSSGRKSSIGTARGSPSPPSASPRHGHVAVAERGEHAYSHSKAGIARLPAHPFGPSSSSPSSSPPSSKSYWSSAQSLESAAGPIITTSSRHRRQSSNATAAVSMDPVSPISGSDREGHGLIKQTYSTSMAIPGESGHLMRKFHVVAYLSKNDALNENLPSPRSIPQLADLIIPHGVWADADLGRSSEERPRTASSTGTGTGTGRDSIHFPNHTHPHPHPHPHHPTNYYAERSAPMPIPSVLPPPPRPGFLYHSAATTAALPMMHRRPHTAGAMPPSEQPFIPTVLTQPFASAGTLKREFAAASGVEHNQTSWAAILEHEHPGHPASLANVAQCEARPAGRSSSSSGHGSEHVSGIVGWSGNPQREPPTTAATSSYNGPYGPAYPGSSSSTPSSSMASSSARSFAFNGPTSSTLHSVRSSFASSSSSSNPAVAAWPRRISHPPSSEWPEQRYGGSHRSDTNKVASVMSPHTTDRILGAHPPRPYTSGSQFSSPPKARFPPSDSDGHFDSAEREAGSTSGYHTSRVRAPDGSGSMRTTDERFTVDHHHHKRSGRFDHENPFDMARPGTSSMMHVTPSLSPTSMRDAEGVRLGSGSPASSRLRLPPLRLAFSSMEEDYSDALPRSIIKQESHDQDNENGQLLSATTTSMTLRSLSSGDPRLSASPTGTNSKEERILTPASNSVSAASSLVSSTSMSGAGGSNMMILRPGTANESKKINEDQRQLRELGRNIGL